jgi:hypothetical protein
VSTLFAGPVEARYPCIGRDQEYEMVADYYFRTNEFIKAALVAI